GAFSYLLLSAARIGVELCLLHPDLGVRDDGLIFLHLVADVFCEHLGGRANRLETEQVQSLLDIGHWQQPGNLALQPVRNIAGHVLRAPQSIPGYKVESFDAGLLDGWNVGSRDGPLEAGQTERLDLSALCQRQRREHRVREQLNLTAHEIGERRRRALVGDDQCVEAGIALEKLDGQMAGGADGGGAECELLRIAPNELKKVL